MAIRPNPQDEQVEDWDGVSLEGLGWGEDGTDRVLRRGSEGTKGQLSETEMQVALTQCKN